MHLVKRTCAVLALIAGLCLVALMLLMFVDVIGRYFFNSPITFSVELVELLMGLLVCFGLAVTALDRGHVSVDLIGGLVPGAMNRFCRMLAALSGGVFMAIIAWKLWARAGVAGTDGLMTPILFLPVAPVIYLMSVASAFAVVAGLVSLFADPGSEAGKDNGPD